MTFFIANRAYPKPDVSKLKGPVLVTGTGGFIGFHTAKTLLDLGMEVVGLDNVNSYYDPSLKESRLAILKEYKGFREARIDLADKAAMEKLFSAQRFSHIIHLAAQAGVRYSLTHPHPYIESNITGFLNLLECARYQGSLGHMVYASSSSVYGMNKKMPFSEDDPVNLPMSLYAVTKRSNELMAQSYYHLFKMPLTGLRFFTVYGPWGRPDMAAFKFVKAIQEGTPIDVYNYGNMARDYTFVGDTVRGILGAVCRTPDMGLDAHKVYNLGNNKLETLSYFIEVLEKHLGIQAIQNKMPIQPGDVPETAADITHASHDFGYSPTTSIDEGLGYFVAWYKDYYATPLRRLLRVNSSPQ